MHIRSSRSFRRAHTACCSCAILGRRGRGRDLGRCNRNNGRQSCGESQNFCFATAEKPLSHKYLTLSFSQRYAPELCAREGLFWMEMESFRRYFEQVTVCKVRGDDWSEAGFTARFARAVDGGCQAFRVTLEMPSFLEVWERIARGAKTTSHWTATMAPPPGCAAPNH